MSVQLIDVPRPPDFDRSWLGSTRVTRTNALPKQTLFGTTLQQREHNVIEDIREIKAKTAKSNGTPKDDNPITGNINARSAQQRKQTIQPDNLLKSVEEKAKYFQMASAENCFQIPRERSKSSQKITENDLNHASDINNVGLQNGNYNHQKYSNKAVQNNYHLIGDPLQGKGLLDLTDITDKPNHLVPQMQPFKRHRDPYAVPKEEYMNKKTAERIVSGTDLAIPANIQHKFGTAVCEHLLANPDHVKNTIEAQAELRRKQRRPHKELEKVNLPPQNLDPSYDEIGTSTRANIFGPSITRHHKIGTMKENFNDDVHKRRVPETDEFKYQRDELSQWWQHQTIRSLRDRQWDEYEACRPKFTVNWDRNAKRPPPPPKPVEKKPKPKPKPKEPTPQPVPKDDIVFEDIEFVTPPLTPPPAREPPPKPSKAVEDDDFWDFYDSAPPLP